MDDLISRSGGNTTLPPIQVHGPSPMHREPAEVREHHQGDCYARRNAGGQTSPRRLSPAWLVSSRLPNPAMPVRIETSTALPVLMAREDRTPPGLSTTR